jgi:SAM-dependent methyltransferase
MTIVDAFCDKLMHAPKGISKILHNPPSIKVIKSLEVNAKILDVGCSGFRQRHISILNGRADIQQFGIDHPNSAIGNIPDGFTFQNCDIEKETFPFENDFFDMVIACHVIEHVRDPLKLFSECIRVCKPNGWISLEAPSEKSLWLPGFPFCREGFFSLSFFDDPTHFGRPWSSQSLYRLAKSFGLVEIHSSNDFNILALIFSPILLPLFFILKLGRLFQYTAWKACGWNARLIAKKPNYVSNKNEFKYILPKTF